MNSEQNGVCNPNASVSDCFKHLQGRKMQ